jgi:hypothetical protein
LKGTRLSFVIASVSEAIHLAAERPWKEKHGLLRRYAPRNDELFFHVIFSTGRPEVGLTSSPAWTKPLRS